MPVSRSDRIRAKIIGLVILAIGVLLLVSPTYFLWRWNLDFSSVYSALLTSALFLVLIISLGILYISLKLLAYESSRPLSFREINKRVVTSSKNRNYSVRPMVISFSGIDGTGKTTQLTKLAKCFKSRKLAYKYVRLRWAAFFSFPFLAFCRLLKYTERRHHRGQIFIEHHFYRNSAVAKTWTLLFTIDLLAFWVYRVKIPLRMGYNVLCDRFVFDALVDVMCDTKQPRLFLGWTGKLLLSLVPDGSLTVFFDLDEQEAYNRKFDIPDISYLTERRQHYCEMASHFKIPILDADAKSEELEKEIEERFIMHYPFWWIDSTT